MIERNNEAHSSPNARDRPSVPLPATFFALEDLALYGEPRAGGLVPSDWAGQAGRGTAAPPIGTGEPASEGHMTGRSLVGRSILLVEEQTIVAIDVRSVLESSGATVVWTTVRDAEHAVAQHGFSAAILDLRPGSNDHRPVARALRRRRIPFLFYSTHAPEDVTTVRGAPVLLKPARPEDSIKAVGLLLA
jgi:CheY-like chemotaxis protein